jgi:hydrogenase maturation protease
MRILIAGIGNIFFGDDAFGCEVARALSRGELPEEVDLEDFGIRSYDLALSITKGYDAVILLDAMQTGRPPGAVTLVQPEMSRPAKAALVDGHALNPMRVLEMLKAAPMQCDGPSSGQEGGQVERPSVYLVGCEPAILESDEIGLSPQLKEAVPKAVALVQALVRCLRSMNRFIPGAPRFQPSQNLTESQP